MAAEILILWAIIPLRIILGILYTVHGYPKLKSPERTATYFLKLRIPLPKLSAIVVAIIEFFGGLALIIGFSTRIVAALLMIEMIITSYLKKTKMKKSFAEGYGYDLVLAAALMVLVIVGAGNWSIDQTFGWLLG